MKPALKYRGLRFERTASAAFRDASYGAAIERPAPSLLQRLLSFFFPNT
jgi:hypothetical protein